MQEDFFNNKKITIKKNKKENKIENRGFDSFFCTGLTTYDLVSDEKALVNALSQLKIIHSRENGGCGQNIKLTFEEKQYRFCCKCGMLLIFPPRQDRGNQLLAKWIPKKKFIQKYKKDS